MKISQPTKESITQAAQALSNGLLVAFPTETVYGLGADASNPDALQRLYTAKGRPSDHPVIVHLATVNQMDDWAANIPDSARRLSQALCPGPLTLILPKAGHVLSQVTGGQASVGLRVPRHPVAQALLQEFGGGIAAPSANKFGRLSPTTAIDVSNDFGADTFLILDGGPSEVGIESTIVDFTGERARILRPGMILKDQIEAIIGPLGAAAHESAPQTRVPGDLAIHYAPVTPSYLITASELPSFVAWLVTNKKKAGVLSFQERMTAVDTWLVAPNDASRYAHQLYANLRKLDSAGVDLMVIEEVPLSQEWSGIADRLRRATQGHLKEW